MHWFAAGDFPFIQRNCVKAGLVRDKALHWKEQAGTDNECKCDDSDRK